MDGNFKKSGTYDDNHVMTRWLLNNAVGATINLAERYMLALQDRKSLLLENYTLLLRIKCLELSAERTKEDR